MSTTTASPTTAVAEWVTTTPLDIIRDDVRDAARWLILDHLACSIGGSRLEPGRTLMEFYAGQGGAPQATIFATGDQSSLLNATYVNSALSNLLDFDDSFPGAGHPGGTIISPALAVAEQRNLSFDQVIDAVVFGYEVSIRLGVAIRPSAERYRVVAGYGVWQTVGAIVAAGKLLGLSTEQFCHALGLGLVNAPVPNMRKLGLEPAERPFSWSKNNYGWAAQGGLLGALLAERGFLGMTSILDGERGFWRMAGSDQWNPDLLTETLGTEWLLPSTGFKPYASCRWTHTALDSVRQLTADHPDLRLSEIDSICLSSFFEATDNMSQPDPTDIIDAQFSIRHVLALELLGRSPRHGLSEADLTDPEVVALRRRIELVEDPEFSSRYLSQRKMPARLTVKTRRGTELVSAVDELPGSPANPLSREFLREKYRALVEPVAGSAATSELERLVLEGSQQDRLGDRLQAILNAGREEQ